MTQAKITDLKNSFNKEFAMIYELCEFALAYSKQPSLLTVTLDTLLRFLNWIPTGYIFDTKLIETLVTKVSNFSQFKFLSVVLPRATVQNNNSAVLNGDRRTSCYYFATTSSCYFVHSTA